MIKRNLGFKQNIAQEREFNAMVIFSWTAVA